jgi:hypothetical protein
MSRIEYRGDLEEVVRAVLQVVTNRARAGKFPGPENASSLVPDVQSQRSEISRDLAGIIGRFSRSTGSRLFFVSARRNECVSFESAV